MLTSNSLTDENSFETPNKISPKQSSFKLKGKNVALNLEPNRFTILKLKLI